MATNEELYEKAMVFYDDLKYFDALPLLQISADAGHLPSAEKLANCYNRTGEPDKAIPYWEICRAAGNHSANTNYAGYLKDFTDQQELAMQLWQEASDAGIPQAAFNLGVWLKDLGRVEEGKVLLKKAGDLGYLDGYFILAGIYYKAEQWAEAREALAPLLAISDERAEKMLMVITMNDGGENSVFVPIGEGDVDDDNEEFDEEMIDLTFEDKAKIISTLWIEFRNDEDFSDFMSYNDIGAPLAYMYANNLATELSNDGEEMIEETFAMFLDAMNVTEEDINAVLPDKNLGAILLFAANKKKFSES